MRIALHPHHILQILLALLFITLFSLLLSECPSLGQDTSVTKVEGYEPGVPNLMQARSGIYTSGQPTVEGLTQLRALNIKTIVNVRPHEETGARDESTETASMGMKYVNIPLTPSSFTLQRIEELHCVLKDPKNYPVLIHCRSGNRASGAWFAYRVLFEKAPVQNALMEAKALGLEPPLEKILVEFIQNAEMQKIDEICRLLR
jgi:uncharacterized protein (TIGR01244 family)